MKVDTIGPRHIARNRSSLRAHLRQKSDRLTRSTFPAWLLLVSILLLPADLAFRPLGAGMKFTAGRAAITLLLIPALARLLPNLVRATRHLILSDLFILLTAAWMLGARFPQDGLNPSAVAEVIELVGGYIVARAYFFEYPELQEFVRIFRIVAVIVISFAVLDLLASKNVVSTAISTITGLPVRIPQFRYGFARAESTIEDAELYGVFCCVAGALCMYRNGPLIGRLMWVGFCAFGCFLSLSSGPILNFFIMSCASLYDQTLKRVTWRWKAFAAVNFSILLAIFLISAKPFSFIVSNFTLDPSTGYFRLFVFDYMIDQISLSPYTGIGFGDFGDDDFLSNVTVDCVWLVLALRFGIPMIVLLLLANVTSFFPLKRSVKAALRDKRVDIVGTGFTFALMSLMIIGITVHYWNAIWMLWGVCLGIRASIKENQVWGGSSVTRSRSVNVVTPGYGGRQIRSTLRKNRTSMWRNDVRS
jgi:hypothetical protein